MNKHFVNLRVTSATMLSIGIVCMPAVSFAAEETTSSTTSPITEPAQKHSEGTNLNFLETATSTEPTNESVELVGSNIPPNNATSSSLVEELNPANTSDQESIVPDAPSEITQATGTTSVQKVSEPLAVQKPSKLFVRIRIEPVAVSRPSGFIRKTPAHILNPARIHSIPAIIPPPQVQESREEDATTTELQIDIATSTIPEVSTDTITDLISETEQGDEEDADVPVNTSTAVAIPGSTTPVIATTEKDLAPTATTTDEAQTSDTDLPSIKQTDQTNAIAEPENLLEGVLSNIVEPAAE